MKTDEQWADERALFEKWAGSRNFMKLSHGGYVNPEINKAWSAWQARASLEAVPASEPVNNCRWPTCESEATQQAIAEEVAESLFGAAAPAPTTGSIADDPEFKKLASELWASRQDSMLAAFNDLARYIDSRASLAAAPASADCAPAAQGAVPTITLTGHQIKAALDLISPVGLKGEHDADELDNDLTFGVVQHRDDDGAVRTGMCCWNDDTDGVLPLDDAPSPN